MQIANPFKQVPQDQSAPSTARYRRGEGGGGERRARGYQRPPMGAGAKLRATGEGLGGSKDGESQGYEVGHISGSTRVISQAPQASQ